MHNITRGSLGRRGCSLIGRWGSISVDGELAFALFVFHCKLHSADSGCVIGESPGYHLRSEPMVLTEVASRGYLNWTNLQEVIDLYAQAEIQLEGIMS